MRWGCCNVTESGVDGRLIAEDEDEDEEEEEEEDMTIVGLFSCWSAAAVVAVVASSFASWEDNFFAASNLASVWKSISINLNAPKLNCTNICKVK